MILQITWDEKRPLSVSLEEGSAVHSHPGATVPHLLSWWVVTIALYRKRTPPQSLAHREDEGDKAAALHTTHLIIAAFPDSRLSRFPGERGGGWEGRGTKTKLRKKLGQSSWGHIVPLWSGFALRCSYAAFRNKGNCTFNTAISIILHEGEASSAQLHSLSYIALQWS